MPTSPRTLAAHALLSACALAAITAAGAVHAQDNPAPTRAEVKAETRAAAKSHDLIPAGEAAGANQPVSRKSNKTRAQRKAETVQARRAGQIEPAGEVAGAKDERTALNTPSTRTRAQRKSETKAAAKAMQLIPAGEGGDAPKH